jgi:hypothetical protein
MKNIKIVYSNKILRFADTNSSKCIASYPNISEWELQDCINHVLTENEGVTFNVIQFDKQDNRVFFYTDDPIKVTYKSKADVVKRATTEEAIKKVLESKDNLDVQLISIFRLLHAIKNMSDANTTSINGLKYDVDMELDIRYGYYSKVELSDMNYIDNTITMMVKKGKKEPFKEITFTKEMGQLKVVSSEVEDAEEILRLCNKSLSVYYDYCLETKAYNTEMVMGITSANPEFICDVKKDGIRIYNQSEQDSIEVVTNSQPFAFVVNSNNEPVARKVRDNVDEFIANTFVRIDDCPSWVKEKAIEYRKEEVKAYIKAIKAEEFWNRVLGFGKKNKKKQK